MYKESPAIFLLFLKKILFHLTFPQNEIHEDPLSEWNSNYLGKKLVSVI